MQPQVGALSSRIGLSVAITLFAATSLVLSQVVFRRVPQMRTLP